jgi:hypothetical protein
MSDGWSSGRRQRVAARPEAAATLVSLPDALAVKIICLAGGVATTLVCRRLRDLWRAAAVLGDLWLPVITKALKLRPGWASAGQPALRKLLDTRWYALDRLTAMLATPGLAARALPLLCGCVGAHHMFGFLIGDPVSALDEREPQLITEALQMISRADQGNQIPECRPILIEPAALFEPQLRFCTVEAPLGYGADVPGFPEEFATARNINCPAEAEFVEQLVASAGGVFGSPLPSSTRAGGRLQTVL